MLEVSAQTCINSQVLPFCDWWEPVAHVTGSIGHGMRAAGIISSPDVMMKSEHRPALGHPPRSHTYSRILTSGDREPKLAFFEKQLKSCLADTETLREYPSISTVDRFNRSFAADVRVLKFRPEGKFLRRLHRVGHFGLRCFAC